MNSFVVLLHYGDANPASMRRHLAQVLAYFGRVKMSHVDLG